MSIVHKVVRFLERIPFGFAQEDFRHHHQLLHVYAASYKLDYHRKKHGDDEDIARLRKLLGEPAQ